MLGLFPLIPLLAVYRTTEYFWFQIVGLSRDICTVEKIKVFNLNQSTWFLEKTIHIILVLNGTKAGFHPSPFSFQKTITVPSKLITFSPIYDVRNNGKVYNVPVVLREVKINHVQNWNTVRYSRLLRSHHFIFHYVR